MSSSRKSIFAAIAADIGIAIAKGVGFAFTGSSAMLSEAIHSLVDCGNGGLLLFGEKQAKQPPDEMHPFGYGKELYFWSLIVAMLIFVLGGGASVMEGISHLRHHPEQERATWAYVVLGVAFLFEGSSLTVSLHEFRKSNGTGPLFAAIHASKDPSSFTVIFEDSAALLGLVFAFFGVWLSHSFGIWQADGIASILIGLLLITVAVLLIRETKGLLVGEGASRQTLRTLRTIAEDDPDVQTAGYPMTMFFGPQNALLTMNVRFRGGLDGSGMDAAIDRIEQAIRSRYPEIQHIFLESDTLRSAREAQAVRELQPPGSAQA